MIRDLLRGALDLVFAPVCIACAGPIAPRRNDRFVCPACWTRARPIPPPRCDRCWTPLVVDPHASSASCGLCESLRPAIRAVRSAFVHDGPVRPLVHALKYRGWYAAAASMGERMAQVGFPPDAHDEIELVVPVPLSPTRLRERGYNQAAELARTVARARAWEYLDDALHRQRSAGTQTTLHRGERRANVAGVFGVTARRGTRIASRHVLLVDDVWTTGATAIACADQLLYAGARAVSVLTFARALPELERMSRRTELIHDFLFR